MTEEEEQSQERKPRRNDKYKCAKCGNVITMHVRVSEPPTCGNSKSHSSVQVMDKI